MDYKDSYINKFDLDYKLSKLVDSFQLIKILGAYDIAENALLEKHSPEGPKQFYHTTRICGIIIDELKINEPDMIIASLLHDIFQNSAEITSSIIQFNFGSYATFLIEALHEDNSQFESGNPDVGILVSGGNDLLIIRLADCLENLRCLEFDLILNPVKYISQISDRYFPIAEKSENKHVAYLVNEIKRERNKLLS